MEGSVRSTNLKSENAICTKAAHPGGLFYGKFPNNSNGYGSNQNRNPPPVRSAPRRTWPKYAQNPLSVSVAEDGCQSDLKSDFGRPRHNKSSTYATRQNRSISTPVRTKLGSSVPIGELPTSRKLVRQACVMTLSCTMQRQSVSRHASIRLSQTSLTSSAAIGKMPLRVWTPPSWRHWIAAWERWIGRRHRKKRGSNEQ